MKLSSHFFEPLRPAFALGGLSSSTTTSPRKHQSTCDSSSSLISSWRLLRLVVPCLMVFLVTRRKRRLFLPPKTNRHHILLLVLRRRSNKPRLPTLHFASLTSLFFPLKNNVSPGDLDEPSSSTTSQSFSKSHVATEARETSCGATTDMAFAAPGFMRLDLAKKRLRLILDPKTPKELDDEKLTNI